jgi:hypothetical protein
MIVKILFPVMIRTLERASGLEVLWWTHGARPVRRLLWSWVGFDNICEA